VNNRKQASSDDLHELAALHALGSLEGPDKVAFEEHLRQGCEACASEVLSFGETAGLIGESVQAVAPGHLRERLLSRIGGSPRIPGILFQHSGNLIARSEELAWQPIASGVFLKPLLKTKPASTILPWSAWMLALTFQATTTPLSRSSSFSPATFTWKTR
jgi:hypothetical protein